MHFDMDYGIAVSQQGKDVKITADRFFTLSSAFHSLKVRETYARTTTIPASGTNTITITHNLGYYAPAIVVYNGSTTLGTGSSYFMSDTFYLLDIEIGLNTIKVNVDSTFDDRASNVGDTVYFTIYSFVDTFDSFSAPVLNTDTSSGSVSSDYGFRVSKPGFDVKTCADVDCIVTSSKASMTVHKKGIANAGATVAHNIGYIPTFLSYIKYDGTDYLTLNNGTYAIDEDNVYFTELNAGDTYYYVVFKSNL